MRDVASLKQLHESGQLVFETEFQRDSVWPQAAKAYLIDTILTDRPIPYLYFRRSISAQSGRSQYQVVDGQQRLRAIFEFLGDGFALRESKSGAFKNKYFSELNETQRAAVLSYDLYIEELTDYSDADVHDVFVRMNRYVVRLSPQEIRHAKFSGRFKILTETMGKWEFWRKQAVFTPLQLRRMRAVEFNGELVVLLVEGPQDKKAALDLYYRRYERTLPFEQDVQTRLRGYLNWLVETLPDLNRTRYRRPTDLYAVIGALDRLSKKGGRLARLDKKAIGRALVTLEKQTRAKEPSGRGARYVAAASRQTDNLAPRLTRIDIISDVIREA